MRAGDVLQVTLEALHHCPDPNHTVALTYISGADRSLPTPASSKIYADYIWCRTAVALFELPCLQALKDTRTIHLLARTIAELSLATCAVSCLPDPDPHPTLTLTLP